MARILSACMLCVSGVLNAQLLPDSLEVLVDSLLLPEEYDQSLVSEGLLEQVLSETDDSEVMDKIVWLHEHPFDLNTATRADLESVPGITPAEADAVIRFRRLVRRFSTVGQLAVIPDVGERLVTFLAPYVYVTAAARPADPRRDFVRMRSRVIRDIQPRKGFQDGSFLGSPVKSYSRISFSSASLQGGALFEKDAGERVKDSYVSGYLRLKDWSIVSNVILGDYVIDAGQGLVLWRGSSFGKGSEVVSVAMKSGLGPQPYGSADEFNFLRGFAITLDPELGGVKFSAFASRRDLSANATEGGTISSFYTTGLFRSGSELTKRGQVREDLIGGRVSFSSRDSWLVGSTFYGSSFSKDVVPGRIFDFRGRSANLIGIDGKVRLGEAADLSRLILFAEIARSGNDALAGIGGMVMSFLSTVQLAVVYRNYAADFTSLHASGFGERSDTKNERGMYIGADLRLAKWLALSGYLDLFQSPWRTFTNPLPTTGRELFIQTTTQLFQGFDLALRYVNKSTATTESALDEFKRSVRLTGDRLQQKFRLTATYRITRDLRVKGRFEATNLHYHVTNKKERGYLLYQEIQYVTRNALACEGRIIFFDTDSFDSRIYEYENDLRGVFSNPALFGKGRRWYVLLRYRLVDEVSLSMKYSETQKENVLSIGSGSTEITGDVDNRVSLQFDVRF